MHRIALALSVVLISCIPCCFMNHEKKNKIKRIHQNVNLTNKSKGTRPFFLSFFWYQTFNTKLITTRNATHYRETITALVSLYQRMKKLSYTLSCIKQNVYTFLFYFLHFSCSYSSHSLHHPSLALSSSSLTFRLGAQPFLSGRCPFFRALHLGIQFSFHPASSLLGT